MTIRKHFLALTGLVIVLLAVLAAVLVLAFREPLARLSAAATEATTAQCEPLFRYTCKDLGPGFISSATGVALPIGTKVTDSGTSAYTSWGLRATVTMPAGAAPLIPPPSYSPTGVIPLTPTPTGRLRYTITQVRRSGETWPIP